MSEPSLPQLHLEAIMAAIMAVGIKTGEREVTAADMFQRYRTMLYQIRKHGGPHQDDIKYPER